ncbi:hypothetical protein PGTUg99_005811 [Puccinia graminis f. sp. tritici]|uniref:No apical meristem-associated C-terminal domain-containing protein n=1 Tax=Puccinia graminis f. sp. tritici TaxID=56615 RepID=A0A5B0M218_PUCGR|nr:hypothetical protein PGTUg99_005811 [Puccinia graminis f. sp. tritici]
MKEEHYNAKKIKVLTSRSNNYRDRTLAMKRTNKICSEAARAEVNQVNMDIMSRREEDLPDAISKEFLQIQKEMIVYNMREQLEERRKSAAQKAKETEQSTSSSTQQATTSQQQLSSSSLTPTSEPNDESTPNSSSEEYVDEEQADPEEIDPTLYSLE